MILFLSFNDWAYVGYNLSMCMKSIGVESYALTINKRDSHEKEQQSIIATNKKMQEYARKANTIVFMHSQNQILTVLKNIDTTNKKIVVFHGGSRYRDNSQEMNNIWNSIVDISLVQTGDLLNLGAKNEVWFMPPIDTDNILPYWYRGGSLTMGHFPSNKNTKGSNEILEVIENMLLDNMYTYSYDLLSWNKNIERMSKCDIYIDAMKPMLGCTKYGEWGVAALEAASLGKIVVSHFLSYERYLKVYGHCHIQIVNSTDDLKKVLHRLYTMDMEDLCDIQYNTRIWAEYTHGYKATANRLLEILK